MKTLLLVSYVFKIFLVKGHSEYLLVKRSSFNLFDVPHIELLVYFSPRLVASVCLKVGVLALEFTGSQWRGYCKQIRSEVCCTWWARVRDLWTLWSLHLWRGAEKFPIYLLVQKSVSMLLLCLCATSWLFILAFSISSTVRVASSQVQMIGEKK